MPAQDHFWNQAAGSYEEDFIDPYRSQQDNPLLTRLQNFGSAGARVVADLGCGIGPLLPFLASHFAVVYAVDFAPRMLDRARQRCGNLTNIQFLQQPLTDLTPLHGQLDVAVSVNSLIMPDVRQLEKSLQEIRTCLRPGGKLLAILPAMDAIHYCTMLLLDWALESGKPLDVARKNAAHHGEHELYDFAFGQFHYKGLEQHFWQPFEIPYRLRRAGFQRIRKTKFPLSWDQHACGKEFASRPDLPPPWDWLVQAEVPQ